MCAYDWTNPRRRWAWNQRPNGPPPRPFKQPSCTHSLPDEAAERAYSLSLWDPTTMQAAIEGIVWQDFNPTASFLCPTTILRADPACGAVFESLDVDPVQTANPHAHIHMIPGSSHSIRTTQPGAYLQHLDQFLNTIL